MELQVTFQSWIDLGFYFARPFVYMCLLRLAVSLIKLTLMHKLVHIFHHLATQFESTQALLSFVFFCLSAKTVLN